MLASLTPVLIAPIPPLVDYPNHLARMHILSHLATSAWLSDYYVLRWRLIPDLAIDLLVPPMASAIGTEPATRLFLALALFLVASGVLALARVVWGRLSWAPVIGILLFLYGRPVTWGFLNYVLGTGLLFWALAAWIGLGHRRRAQIAIASLAAPLLYLAHIAALGLYAVSLAGWTCERLRRSRGGLLEAAVSAVPFIAPAVLYLTAGHESGGPIRYAGLLRKIDMPLSAIQAYHPTLEGGALVLLAALVWVGVRRGEVLLAAGLRGPLVAIAITFLLLPSQAAGGSGLDHRIPWVLLLVASAALAPKPQAGRGTRLVVRALIGIGLLHVADIAWHWSRAQGVYARALAVIDQLPRGARIAVASPPGSTHAGETAPLIHIPLLAVVRRDAFVPTLFARPGQQPVLLRPPWDRIAADLDPAGVRAALSGRPDRKVAAGLSRVDAIIWLHTAERGRNACRSEDPVSSEAPEGVGVLVISSCP